MSHAMPFLPAWIHTEMALIKIHHLGLSQSERIVWLCEELGLPYELVTYERDPTSRLAPSAYRAIHPLGKAPVIEDGQLRLPESGAIVEYIARKYSDGCFILGPDHPDFAHYLFWFHFANASLMPNIMLDLVIARLSGGKSPSTAQAAEDRSSRGLNLLEARLREVPYLAGKMFTLADIMILFPLTTMRHFAPRDLGAFPHVSAYLQRVGARPAYRTAMAKCDPGQPLRLD